MTTLLIDDERTQKDFEQPITHIARTYNDGIWVLQSPVDELLLDCNLGETKSGVDIIVWLTDHPEHQPKIIEWVTNSMDVVEMMSDAMIEMGYHKITDRRWEK